MNNSTGSQFSQPPQSSSVGFWGALSAAERQAFMLLARERTFAGGATLMREGEPGTHVIVILSGWTRITVHDKGRERVIAERGPGQLIGERAALHVSVRSATVVALEMVRGLVMKTADFADFVSAHQSVLGIVEGQVYGRLTEESARLAPRQAREDLIVPVRDIPAGHRPGLAVGKPLSELQQLFHGENCMVVLTDVVGFGAHIRNDDDRLIIRKSLHAMMGTALGEIAARCYCEDRGDGLLLIAPASIPTVDVLQPLLDGLPRALKRHNRTYGPCVQIQLRMSSDVGPVTSDDLGVQGEVIIRAARLLEAAALRKSVVRDRANLGVVVSPFIFDTVIRRPGGLIDSAGFARIHVHVKETSQQAWMKLLDPAPAEVGPVACLWRSRRRPATAPPCTQHLPGCWARGRAVTGEPAPAVRAGAGANAHAGARSQQATWSSTSFRSSGQDSARAGCRG